MSEKAIKPRRSQNEEATVLLRIISLIAGVFTIIIVSLLIRIYPSYNLILTVQGVIFSSIYLLIFILTMVSTFVKSKAAIILYIMYYSSSIAALYSAYLYNFSELQLKIVLLTTFAVILGMTKLLHLITYIIVTLTSIIFLLFVVGNNGVDKPTTLAIFIMFFLLSYVNLRSKLTTRKALIDAEVYMKQMAYYDALTGLPNRHKFNSFVSDLLNKIKGSDDNFAVVFIDLDNFKTINDSLGHNLGDMTLIEVAKILVNCVNKGDIVSRFGGDEFVIILNNISEKESIFIVNKIINELSKPLLLEGHEIYTTTSIGISLYPLDGITVETLINNADIAMYEAKGNGRNNYCFFDENFDKTIKRHMELENGLRRALQRKEFHLCYQPQVYLETGELWGIEALIRWNHPVLGIIDPLEFIPIAEESSLIISIGEWVIETACNQNKLWQDMGLNIVPIAVKVSVLQLKNPSFVETVSRCLNNAKLDPKYLVVELTESIMQDKDITFEAVNRLKALGVRVAIADFGTGYSSLSLLKDLNIDTIKINSDFIKDIAVNSNTISIIKLIIEMGNCLKFNTIIEGIDSLKQSKVIVENGCRLGQGSLFSNPVSVEEVKNFIKKV